MIVILMGVTGAGKTTIGRLLAKELAWAFYDADDFHSAANVEKMRRGVPLDDLDREGWLKALNSLIRDLLSSHRDAVLACSALKAAYRKYLIIDKQVRLVYLRGDSSLIEQRLAGRKGHYMNPSLLESQLATLEEPQDALTAEVSGSPSQIVSQIRQKLGT
jgi:gluconokinase